MKQGGPCEPALAQLGFGLTADRDGVPLPLANWGAGTRRLAALAIAEQRQGDRPVTIVDEFERGLTQRSSTKCRTSGVRSRIAASARSTGINRRAVLHGRGRADSRTCAQRLASVRAAGTAPETPLAQLRTIELHLVPPTV
jgi:hypothetical protein